MKLLAATRTPDLENITQAINFGEGLVWGGIISAISLSCIFVLDKTFTYFENKNRD